MNSYYSFLFVIVLGLIQSVGQAQSDKPNVIFILADDLGYGELGCFGNSFNETPNLDQLAMDGTRFTQAYASAPVCSPYRAAFMTGQYPVRIGINDYLRSWTASPLDTAHYTLAEALRSNGYHTGIIGKWHLTGYLAADAPVEIGPALHGFEEVISSETTGIANGSYFHPYHFNPDLPKMLEEPKEFLIDRMNQEALGFIERNKDQPFFLYLSHYAVHTMLHGEPEWVNHFRSKDECGSSPPSKKNEKNDPYEKRPADYMASQNNPHLAAQLKVIDEGVDMIRTRLDELGLAENTIIIFTSDNGGESRVTSNQPLRAGKSTTYEGGIRVPLVIYNPQSDVQLRTSSFITSNFDFYPTICEMTGTSLSKHQLLDGISLVKTLEDSTVDIIRPLYWYYPLDKRHFLGGRSSGAMRRGKWKLISFFDTGESELYNLETDLAEINDLSKEEPEILVDMLGAYDKWLMSTKASIE